LDDLSLFLFFKNYSNYLLDKWKANKLIGAGLPNSAELFADLVNNEEEPTIPRDQKDYLKYKTCSFVFLNIFI